MAEERNSRVRKIACRLAVVGGSALLGLLFGFAMWAVGSRYVGGGFRGMWYIVTIPFFLLGGLAIGVVSALRVYKYLDAQDDSKRRRRNELIVLMAAYVLVPLVVFGLLECGLHRQRQANIKGGFFSAVAQGQLEVVRRRLDSYPNLLEARRSRSGETPVQVAASKGQIEVLEFLLSKGAAKGPFVLAALGELGRLRELLEEGGLSPDAATPEGDSLVHVAARNGRQELVGFLLERGVPVGITNARRLTPLHQAAWGGHGKVARLLLEHGADIDARDDYGSTALNLAAVFGHLEVAELLVEKGAALNITNQGGKTPLYTAVEQRNKQLVIRLMELGADINVRPRSLDSALLRVTKIRGWEDVAARMRELGGIEEEAGQWWLPER